MKHARIEKNFLCRLAGAGLVACMVFAMCGCMRVKVEPIHITVDVNVKVDRELENVFGDLDRKGAAAVAASDQAKQTTNGEGK